MGLTISSMYLGVVTGSCQPCVRRKKPPWNSMTSLRLTLTKVTHGHHHATSSCWPWGSWGSMYIHVPRLMHRSFFPAQNSSAMLRRFAKRPFLAGNVVVQPLGTKIGRHDCCTTRWPAFEEVFAACRMAKVCPRFLDPGAWLLRAERLPPCWCHVITSAKLLADPSRRVGVCTEVLNQEKPKYMGSTM